MSIHDTIREKTELATTYAEDGAFHTAARILEDLATLVSRHAIGCDAAMAAGLPASLKRRARK